MPAGFKATGILGLKLGCLFSVMRFYFCPKLCKETNNLVAGFRLPPDFGLKPAKSACPALPCGWNWDGYRRQAG